MRLRFPHSALPWGRSPRILQFLFQLRRFFCSSPCQLVSLFLVGNKVPSTFLPWFLTSICDSGFHGDWGPQVPPVLRCPQLVPATVLHVNFTSVASVMCPEDLFQVWLFTVLMFQHWLSSEVSGVCSLLACSFCASGDSCILATSLSRSSLLWGIRGQLEVRCS